LGLFGRDLLYPEKAQVEILEKISKNRYIKLPKAGTNPRGVEVSQEAVELLVEHEDSRKLPVEWHREDIEYNPYKRWIDLWIED